MATIKVCDWTKKQIAPNAQTVKLAIDGKQYEISIAARDELLKRLESETVPDWRPTAPPAPPARQPQLEPEDDIGINVEAPSPFGGTAEEGLTEGAPRPPAHGVAPISIPQSTKERLPQPSQTQVDAVVSESIKFQEGTLKALTPGKHRTLAQQKLASREAKFEDNTRPVPERGRTQRGE